jgi:hypothetical protein
MFQNGTVQIYSNRVLLRNPDEKNRAPKGPPLWSESEASLVKGQEVAIYEVDSDVAACVCAREMGVKPYNPNPNPNPNRMGVIHI